MQVQIIPQLVQAQLGLYGFLADSLISCLFMPLPVPVHKRSIKISIISRRTDKHSQGREGAGGKRAKDGGRERDGASKCWGIWHQ